MSRKEYIHHIHGNPADNTMLDCPDVSCKYNADTYDFSKICILFFSIVLLIVSVLLIIFSKNSILQMIASAVLGGVFSAIVWLITVWHNDKTNAEISRIEHRLYIVDSLINSINTTTNIINYETLEITSCDQDDYIKRLLIFVGKLTNIKGIKEIDCSKLELKWLDGQDCFIDNFLKKFNHFMENPEPIKSNYDIDKILNLNEYILKTELTRLKEKLLRQRLYVICGDAPVDQKDVDRRIKLKRIFEIFNKVKNNE